MEIVAYIVLAIALWQCGNVVMNFLFRQRIGKASLLVEDKVSVLIPARNEINNIGRILKDLQDTSGNIEVLIYDDNSTDATADVVMRSAERDPRIRLIKGKELPKAWLGKPHACYQLSKEARGDYLLFVDADVRLDTAAVAETVHYLKKKKLSLLTIFPKQVMLTKGEKMSVPLMNYILLNLLPLVFVRRSPFTAHRAANGQFMLFEGKKYRELQPHQYSKQSAVEDIAIAGYYKKQSVKVACVASYEKVRCRMYDSFHTALAGFSKNVLHFFGDCAALAIIFAIVNSLGVVAMFSLGGDIWLAYLMLQILNLLMVSNISGMNPVNGILYFPFQMVFLWQLLLEAIVVRRNKDYRWKGRDIYS